MKKQILELEALASILEPDAIHREELRKKIIGYTENFLEEIEELNAFNASETTGKELWNYPVNDKPISIDELLRLFGDNVDFPGLNPASGKHLGYIPGGGIFHSSVADYLAAVTNRYAGIFYASPGAVRIENIIIDWLGKLAGYPEGFAGNLTSGGSLANLIGIVTARDAYQLKGGDFHKTVIYASEQMHHCLNKAIRIAGLSECELRYVPLDENFRIIPSVLNQMIEEDKKNGLRPWLIIASAGTTDVGAIDPLEEIGDVSKKHDLWFHVDAAYGGFFLLSDEGKTKMKGIEKSDSLVMDPHKGLFLPYGSGVVLIRNRKAMLESHHYLANYMQDALSATEELSPADLSPELTKHFRGLRIWLPLKVLGTAPFKAALNEKLLLTKYFLNEIRKNINFEVLNNPDLTVVAFRYIPPSGDSDEFNEKLVRSIQNDGRIFLTSTRLNGKFAIRLAVLSFRTHLKTIDLALEIILEKASELVNENGGTSG